MTNCAAEEPDLSISLHLDAYAPRAARHHVGQVDRPSPDLRDAVMLLTSEMVTRAVQQSDSLVGDVVQLRVWMPGDVVRVELHGACGLLAPETDSHRGNEYDLMLLDHVADRWSTETHDDDTCMWFEIDRHETRGRVGAGV
jgi:hypothetical protein